MSRHKLAELYHAAQIKQKPVKAYPRQFSARLAKKRIHERVLLKNALQKAKEQDIPLYFLDETIVVQKMKHKAWSAPGEYLRSYHFNRYEKNMTVTLCINSEGLVCYSI